MADIKKGGVNWTSKKGYVIDYERTRKKVKMCRGWA